MYSVPSVETKQYHNVFLLNVLISVYIYLLSSGTEYAEFSDNSICRLFRMVDDYFLILTKTNFLLR